MVTIRKAKLEDAKKLRDLCFELLLRFEKMDKFDSQDRSYWKNRIPGDIKKLIRKKDNDFFVAEENGKMIGFIELAMAKRESVFKIKRYGHIELLYVKPEHRGKGYSKLLLNKAVRWFKSKKAEYVTVSTHALDKGANSFWKKQGFSEYNLKYRKTIP
ncbi:GNAT family N-acetyltransferase [Candidatus Woesearchaeota archaeon]|nr:GNAT family N-acetyltransferase [Candidatus Woesearchaeota archaeon]